MEIQYFGANCVKLITKKAVIIVDDTLASLGLKGITSDGDILLLTEPNNEKTRPGLTINTPGEYEISGITITGSSATPYAGRDERPKNTVYKIETGEVSVVVIGHVDPNLGDEFVENLGKVDIAILPVGGNKTLTGADALKIIKKIEPKIIIPTYYADDAIAYPDPQARLEEALKELAMESHTKSSKYRYNPGELSENTHLVVLERS